MEENRKYKCTLMGGCSFTDDNGLCNMPGTQCVYKREATKEELEPNDPNKDFWYRMLYNKKDN